jgi:hypothetical protein
VTAECEVFELFRWHDKRCARDVESSIVMAKAAFNMEKKIFTRKLGLLKEKIAKRYT